LFLLIPPFLHSRDLILQLTSSCDAILYMGEVPRLSKFYGWFFSFFQYGFLHRNPHVEQQRSHLFRISKYYIDHTLVYIEQQLEKKHFQNSAFQNGSCQLNFVLQTLHYCICDFYFDSKFLYSVFICGVSCVKNKHVKEIGVEFSHRIRGYLKA